MLSKLKYIVILTDLFCSVVKSGTSHFHSFFPRKWFLAAVDFWYNNYGLCLASQAQAQNDNPV